EGDADARGPGAVAQAEAEMAEENRGEAGDAVSEDRPPRVEGEGEGNQGDRRRRRGRGRGRRGRGGRGERTERGEREQGERVREESGERGVEPGPAEEGAVPPREDHPLGHIDLDNPPESPEPPKPRLMDSAEHRTQPGEPSHGPIEPGATFSDEELSFSMAAPVGGEHAA